jgi:hypothetical protein
MALLVTGVLLQSLVILALGWLLGYRSVAAYARFWLCAAVVVAAGLHAARRWFPPRGAADSCIRAGVLSFAAVVGCGLVLASVRQLAYLPYLVSLAALLAGSLLLPSRRAPAVAAGPSGPVPIIAFALVAAVVVFVVAFGITHAPFTLYDAMSYHLFFPARWLQDRRLLIIPTPFSDEAQAYAPANGELFFAWLMLPFHGDLLARIGQLPFYLVGGTALYAIARRLGAERQHAVYPAAFYLLARPIVEQAVGADVDLICTGMFLASVYLGLIAGDTGRPRDWIICGISLGLFWGSKYVALVWTPVLLLLVLPRGARCRALWAIPGIAALALPWYVRNWIVAGSPIYPSDLTLAGLTLARGAFTRRAMFVSVFHATSLRELAVVLAHAFGPPLSVVWLVLAGPGVASLARRRPRWPAVFVVVAPVLIVAISWLSLPDNVDSRYFLPAIALALIPFAFAFRSNRIWNGGLHTLYAAAMVWLVVGSAAVPHPTLRWYMAGWLSLHGLVEARFFAEFFGLVLVLALVAWRVRRVAQAALLAAAVGGTAVVVLASGVDTWCVPSHCDYLEVSPTFVRYTFIFGWRWVEKNVHGATIAYTGNNLPYLLTGTQLTNQVRYVNIDQHVSWCFHDYARAFSRRGGRASDGLLLATSSGELRRINQPSGGPVDASRPRYERMEGSPEAWLQNLRTLQVDYLFVSTLLAYEIDYVWHDEGGFPIEDTWARANPAVFRRVYDNVDVRIYAIDRRR